MIPVGRLLSGSGRFPERLRAELDDEGTSILLEGIRGTMTLRNYRGPRAWSWHSVEKQWLRCALAVTSRRLVVRSGRRNVIDMPFADPRWSALDVTLEEPDQLRIAIADLGRLDPARSGQFDVLLRSADAPRIAEALP